MPSRRCKLQWSCNSADSTAPPLIIRNTWACVGLSHEGSTPEDRMISLIACFAAPEPTTATTPQPAKIYYDMDFYPGYIGLRADGNVALAEGSLAIQKAVPEDLAMVKKAFAEGKQEALLDAGRAGLYSFAVPIPGDCKPAPCVLLHSPGNVSTQSAALQKVGGTLAVAIITGFHDHYALDFQAAYPKAVIVSNPTVKHSHPSLRIDHLITPNKSAPLTTPIPLSAKLAATLGGAVDFYWHPDENELLPYHKPSQTLFSNDLLYEIDHSKGSWNGVTHPFVNIALAAFQLPSISPPYFIYRTWMVSPQKVGVSSWWAANNGTVDRKWRRANRTRDSSVAAEQTSLARLSAV